jgi:hypothetical protein
MAHHAPDRHYTKPFFRADQNYARLAHISDYIKPSPYNNCAGPRLAQYVRNIESTIFRDFTPYEVLEIHYKISPPDRRTQPGQIVHRSLSANYVFKEAERAIADVKCAVPIYPGSDIDIPTALTEKRASRRESGGARGIQG